MKFYPEGFHITAIPTGISGLREAMHNRDILQARAEKCDAAHNLHLHIGDIPAVIPRGEGAVGIAEGVTRDIALLSRVGKYVGFTVREINTDAQGNPLAVLSRREAQLRCKNEYLDMLVPGDVITAAVTRCERFGVFCDIGAGIPALLPIDAVSVSRIGHPSVRFAPGDEIRVIVKGTDEEGRMILSHRELLGTWEENAALFAPGETVTGVVRSVESYGVFVELTPNLAGLAEYTEEAREGQSCSVFIKSILPDRMKVKLVIVDCHAEPPARTPIRYFYTGSHMDSFVYSPEGAGKRVETVF